MDSAKRLTIDSEGTQEVPVPTVNPLLFGNVLAPEIWDHIAGMVVEGSSEDYLNLINSSTFFQRLRALKRTTCLFEVVLPLIAKSVWRNEGLEGFPVKDVLKCRLVCSDWNAAVKKVVPHKFGFSGKSFIGKGAEKEFEVIGETFDTIQENEFWITRETDDDDGWTDAAKKEEESHSVYRFLHHFSKTHLPTHQSTGSNPFFCRKIELYISEDVTFGDDFERFKKGIFSLLSTHGTQVDSFKVQIANVPFFEDEFSLMFQWISLLPNLKQFEFKDDAEEDDDFRETNLDVVGLHPIPKLESLKTIKIFSQPQPIFNRLLQQNNHVSELWLGGTEQFDIYTFPLPNLKKLTLGECPRDIVALLSSPHAKWSLDTLALKSVNVVGGWGSLFQVIQEKFSQTLVSFSFDVDNHNEAFHGAVWMDFYKLRLDLPNLKEIRFKLGDKPVCLDFLLPMANNLERIRANYNERLPHVYFEQFSFFKNENPNVVQFNGFERRMLESNIWKIFKKLNQFEMKIYRNDATSERLGAEK